MGFELPNLELRLRASVDAVIGRVRQDLAGKKVNIAAQLLAAPVARQVVVVLVRARAASQPVAPYTLSWIDCEFCAFYAR